MKAEIKSGSHTIMVDGTPEEVFRVIENIRKESLKNRKVTKGESLSNILSRLVEEDFFNTPRAFGEILEELKKRGYGRYPRTSVSAVLLRDFVRTRVLRRTGISKKYKYVLNRNIKEI